MLAGLAGVGYYFGGWPLAVLSVIAARAGYWHGSKKKGLTS